MDRLTVYRVFLRAMEAGGRQLGPFEIEWEISGRCLTPIRRDVTARKTHSVKRYVKRVAPDWATSDFPPDYLGWSERVEYGAEKLGPYVVHLTTKCRRCDNCLAERSSMWAHRAVAEVRAASRTWYGTLTLSPQWHERFAASARLYAARRLRTEFEALPFAEQFQLRHRMVSAEIQKMFKRLRKSGARFRYLLVVEPHTGKRTETGEPGQNFGLPHYHLLVHEIGAPISKRSLEAEWSFGFVQWRLRNDPDVAWYVAKYLSKTLAARVRASLGYGLQQSASAVASETLREPLQEALTYQAAPSPSAKPLNEAQPSSIPSGTAMVTVLEGAK